MDIYAVKEIKEITNELNREMFFNLTNHKITQELIKNLKLGKQYTPETKYSSTVEIAKFNSEVANHLSIQSLMYMFKLIRQT